MKAHAAWLIGACLAAGPALAQTPLPADKAMAGDVMDRAGWQWRLEVSPPLRVAATHFDQDQARPALATGVDPRLWIGDRRTQLGFSLRGDGLDKGTLLRTQLSGDAALALRLRGGKVGLFVAIPLNGK